MPNKKKILVFIQGRLNSQRLPNKLIEPIGDSCLWEQACRAVSNLNKTKYKVAALCRDKKLIDIARNCKLKVVLRSKLSVEIDGPNNLVQENLEDINCTHMCMVNACHFFLQSEELESALEKFRVSNYLYEYATSVKKFNSWLYDKNGNPVTKLPPHFSTKHQDAYWEPAHILHIYPKERFYKNGKMLNKRPMLLEFKGDCLLDVDVKEDLDYMRYKYEKNCS